MSSERKQQYLPKDEQQQNTQWIENVLNIDRRTSKDPRLYCAYCGMNNHPRFACKHACKCRIETKKHRCTFCSAFHAPFCCPRAQCNEGSGKPSWARIEWKRAKQESREPDLRWGSDAAQPLMESPVQESQQHQSPSEDQAPMCAATAMMHGIPSGAASSWQGAACPSIHEHRQWAPQATENDVILPNPGHKVDANIWHLNIRERALLPGPMASFLRHCNTMESPPNPSYLSGCPQPMDDIQDLRKETSMENLVKLQCYLERFQFETTCLRLWSNGIHDQITDEAQKVHTYMRRMTEELNGMRRFQPG